MQLPEISIRRPVFATVLSLLILLVGWVSFNSLTVREYPKIDEPNVTVTTRFPGASSEVVESQVTKTLEDSLAGIEGVDVITSISRQEQSQITVRFKLERDPDAAAAEVRDKVARVRGRLPQTIDEPVVAKVEADAFPVVWIALSSDTHSALQLSDYANRIAKPVLQTATGVADVRVYGERKYSMRLWLDPDRLAAYRLTVQDVEDALRRSNLEVPAGRIESRQREFNVTATTDLQTADEFSATVIRTVNGLPVRIADVARVVEGPQDERTSVRLNGRDAISLGVIRQATANPLELSAAVRELLDKVREDLPPGINVQIANDNSVFIDRSIKAVYTTIAEAVVLVTLVIFVFLRTVRASIIPLVTIPVSLIGAFALMALFGFSINTLTLLALVLAIGLVVDDAIVVLENIYRHIEEGVPPIQASLKGAREIGFAVVAMTITLAAVYAPVAFMTGRIGKLFIEFALTLAGAVLVSGFVALTLSPMMCSVLLRHEANHGKAFVAIETLLDGLNSGYRRWLGAALKRRWLVLLAFAVVALAGVGMLKQLKSELSPVEDRGVIFGMFTAPEGATLEYTDRYARQIEQTYATIPEAANYFIVSGNPVVSQGIAVLRFKDWSERQRSTPEVAKQLFGRFATIPGVNAFPVTPPSLGQSPRERPINFVLISSASYPELQATTSKFLAEMAKNPGFLNVDTDLKLNLPQLAVAVNRDKAADLGVSVETVGRTLETMLGGRQVTRYKQNGEQYDVIVQVADAERRNPSDIRDLYVRGKSGNMIPLSNLVQVNEAVSPRELNHFGQRRAVTITANLAPGYTQGEGLAAMESLAAQLLPAGYAVDYNGQSREFKTSTASLTLTFVLALAFIYLVLAAQFESFRDPFIIMLTVPLSMAGALLALLLTGGTLNVYSQIGLVTLVGLITKHGILIVEFANQLQEKGSAVQEAVVEAAVLRLRPILMTTGAMVLGAIPLALARGAGAESRSQIGWVIVGGLLLGTLFTLFVVPTVYTLMARQKGPDRVSAEAARHGQAS